MVFECTWLHLWTFGHDILIDRLGGTLFANRTNEDDRSHYYRPQDLLRSEWEHQFAQNGQSIGFRAPKRI